jgi:hypothetical protein
MRTVTGAVLAVLVLGLVSGCGTGARGPGVASAQGAKAKASPTPSLDPEERRRRFSQCLRDHGVEVHDPDSGSGGEVRITRSPGPGGDKDPFAACQQYLPEGKLAEIDPAELDKIREYAKCMREHGVDMPDPDAASGGAMVLEKGDGAGRVNPDDPALKEAEKACQGKLPGRMAVAGQVGGGE